MKALVLAEKPSVGRDLAKVLGCDKGSKAYLEGKDYIVTWAMGHLVELVDPEVYNEKFKAWSLDTLPMLPDRMRYKVIGKTSRQFREIKGLLNRKDVNRLIIATDAGREGELVARLIMRLAGWKGPVQRLWISSQTEKAIKDGFKNLKPGKDYENLFRAAECRAEADWLIGLNVTRAMSCRWDARLSAGRVQTPTLAILVQREEEIDNFIPKPYWTLNADFGKYSGLWQGKGGRTRVNDESVVKTLAEKLQGSNPVVTEVKIRKKLIPSPLAYDLTELQREANRRHGYSAKRTLQVLQVLYERYKIVSYPRTDSRYITSDMASTLRDRLKALSNTGFAKGAALLAKGELNPGKRLINDARVTDHHALIPTEQRVDTDKLSGEEKAIWTLIVMRFLAVLSPPEEKELIEVVTEMEGERFLSRGSRVLKRGWREVEHGPLSEEDDGDMPEQRLANIEKGQEFSLQSTHIRQGKTSPPPRYNEATLLTAMENPGNKDKDLKEALGGTGLGTPATRADIIEKILSNYYVERRGKELIPTSTGRVLLELVPPQFQSAELTAKWEQRLSRIVTGVEKADSFRKDIRNNTKSLVDEVKNSKKEYKPRNLSSSPCPLCSKMMMKVMDKKGRPVMVCPSRSCGYEEGNEKNRDGKAGRPNRREQAVARQGMKTYGVKTESEETFTLADMMKSRNEGRSKRK